MRAEGSARAPPSGLGCPGQIIRAYRDITESLLRIRKILLEGRRQKLGGETESQHPRRARRLPVKTQDRFEGAPLSVGSGSLGKADQPRGESLCLA